MTDKKESLIERMKKLPLWTWGMLFIFGGLIGNMIGTLSIEARNLSRANERAALMGNTVATLLMVIGGIVLIILYFIRRKRKK